MSGKILDVNDFGSIVMMHLALDDRRIAVVPFDHRAFHWLLDGEQCEADDLIGRSVNYDGEQVAFLDDDD
jgi:hypothetical protein